MSFSEFYKLEKFQPLFEHHQIQNIDDDWRKKNSELEDSLIQALITFLIFKRDNQQLSKMENSDGHIGNFIGVWNRFVENKPLDSYHLEEMASTIVGKSLFWLTQKNNLEEAFSNLVARIDSGDFPHYDLPDSEYCFGCGKKFKMQFHNWSAELLESSYDPDKPLGQRFTYFPALTCEIEPLVQVDVQFKTGEILVADWFRLPAFTTMVDEGVNFDVNCDVGRSNQARHYALHYNFISIPAWRDTELFMKDEQIYALHNTWETQPEGYIPIGRHCLGLRAVTLIDKAQLIEMVAKKSSIEVATQTVQEYIDKENITCIHIAPGSYRFTFSGNHMEMSHHLSLTELAEYSPVFVCEKIVPSKKLRF